MEEDFTITVDKVSGTDDNVDEADVFEELGIALEGVEFHASKNTYKIREVR